MIERGFFMNRAMVGALVISFVFLTAGCSELKKLRIETELQKSEIEQLKDANQACQADLLKSRDSLKAKDAALRDKEVRARKQSDAFTKMQEAMKAELEKKQVALKELEGKLTLTMVEAVLFGTGSARLKPEGEAALKKVAEVLKSSKDQDIVVAGHTDNVQVSDKLKKTYATNWELSSARAITVVKLLASCGVDPKLMSASGFGENRPVADNATWNGRAKNRRMEIILMPRLK
jgi:chemotaxis protein MotB